MWQKRRNQTTVSRLAYLLGAGRRLPSWQSEFLSMGKYKRKGKYNEHHHRLKGASSE